jgi:hypothetical protein
MDKIKEREKKTNEVMEKKKYGKSRKNWREL